MARKSMRLSASTPASTGHKRAVSATVEAPLTVKKAKTGRSTKGEATEAEDVDQDAETSLSEPEDELSDFAAEAESAEDDDEVKDEESEDDYDSEEDAKPRRKPTHAKGKELWREGVKAGIGPGKQLIIKRPKARPAGKVPYADGRIHPNTLLFLEELKANNDREWLKMHDPDFRQAEKDWFGFVEKLTEKLTEIDDTVPELPVKDVIFRIYRDVRFSKDPTPYSGGLWHPEAAPTAAMRRDIDRRPNRLKDILLEPRVRRDFLKNAPASAQKAVKAFISTNEENALKTRPKGYAADHPDIALMRLRNYTIGSKVSDKELLNDGLTRITDLLACMKPFITYLNSVVMPDEDASNDDEDDDEGSDEAEGSEASASDDNGNEASET
ncbi:hypothetical protein B0A48_07754 [Cryoendolithus antarcticus]|uniref:DUF2461 domain-containing protein n=1 Tax=Cryoendolithus antarcticus TaxID=1507870 RepID=A0A1V8T711_9PEZI|nr:hypothetical protein B0A48_07754 [Cryoendolithus antarcticus]